jgi:hypothetical protein
VTSDDYLAGYKAATFAINDILKTMKKNASDDSDFVKAVDVLIATHDVIESGGTPDEALALVEKAGIRLE